MIEDGGERLRFVQLMIESHRRLVGRPLANESPDLAAQARWLADDAPFGLLATTRRPTHPSSTQTSRRSPASSTRGRSFGLPSRLTAEAPDRAERQRLLDTVARDGFVDGYRGLRIAKSGRRFWIEDVTVWMLVDDDGRTHGQAAAYRRWRDV